MILATSFPRGGSSGEKVTGESVIFSDHDGRALARARPNSPERVKKKTPKAVTSSAATK
jgi:hypothetical protein